MENLKFIGIDWGTSSFRAYLFDHNGQIIDRLNAPDGIMQIEDGLFEDVFYKHIGDWLAQFPNSIIVASGMITSQQGWVETPYLPCPAKMTDLAENLVSHLTIKGDNIFFVPGVCQHEPVANIMRGEETQMAGLEVSDKVLAILPGTHSKWILMENDTIKQFSTFMTGEIFATLVDHTILGRFVSDNDDDKAFKNGIEKGFKDTDFEGGILSKLFSARALPLLGAMKKESVKDYLSGLLLGNELRDGLKLEFSPDIEPVLCGSESLVNRYQAGFDKLGIKSKVHKEDPAITGLFRIAQKAQLLHG